MLFKKLVGVRGRDHLHNDVFFSCSSGIPEVNIIFFGGDIQNEAQIMEKHRDNRHYVKWSLDATSELLIGRLSDSFPNGRAPASSSLDVLTVYRPPRNDPTADARLIEDLERFSIRSDVLIIGDFNAPLIDWSSAYASDPNHAFYQRLLDMTLKVIEAWNALPTDVVMSTSAEAFKRKLDQCTPKRHNAA
nr:unnamed protein product [Spirometra erinaceieuropaei]